MAQSWWPLTLALRNIPVPDVPGEQAWCPLSKPHCEHPEMLFHKPSALCRGSYTMARILLGSCLLVKWESPSPDLALHCLWVSQPSHKEALGGSRICMLFLPQLSPPILSHISQSFHLFAFIFLSFLHLGGSVPSVSLTSTHGP